MIIRSAKIVICSLYPVHYDCHTLCQSLFCSPRLSLAQPMFMFCSAQQSHTQSRLHAVISAKDFCSPQQSQVDWGSLASFVHHDTHTFSKTGLVVSFIMIVTCSLEKNCRVPWHPHTLIKTAMFVLFTVILTRSLRKTQFSARHDAQTLIKEALAVLFIMICVH